MAGEGRIVSGEGSVSRCVGVLFGSEAWLCVDAATAAGLGIMAAQLHSPRGVVADIPALVVVFVTGCDSGPLGFATAKRCSAVDDSLLVRQQLLRSVDWGWE